VVAFVAQLAVLPGEKVQFIIAGLATRYDPLVVIAAAGSAFAGWTALEIAFGQALRTLLPGIVLDGITAALFLAFAVLLFRSAPDRSATPDAGTEADGGHEPLDVPFDLEGRLSGAYGGFVPIFVMMAAGEFGDKTQLITISLAVQYGATPAIWAGEMLAIIPVSLANAYFFDRFAGRVDLRKAHLVSAALFVFFGLDTVLSIVADVSVWETFVAAVSSAVA
jgi:putative Ca2+/H+ antiporter (TMEM165/GDT1 family)